MLHELGLRLGFEIRQDVELPAPLGAKPDGLNIDEKVAVEAYARIGPLKAGHRHKIKGDILKLALIGTQLGPEWRKIICFASPETASFVQGRSWVAQAAREFGIEVVVVELPEEARLVVEAAQIRQLMVNPS